MRGDITKRIERELELPGLVEALGIRISPSYLQSLLLAVYEERSGRVSDSALYQQFDRNSLFSPSPIGARVFNDFDRAAFACAHAFEAIDLAPACPFGSVFALGATAQNKIGR